MQHMRMAHSPWLDNMQLFALRPKSLSMTRQQRLGAIKTLVAQGQFRTQGELVEALEANGIEVTQSSVSRDIKELGLQKEDGIYVIPSPSMVGRQAPALRHIVAATAAGDHMVVVKTLTATAQLVAAMIDHSGWDGVAGTIAGDDTVFVATTSREGTLMIVQRLRVGAGLDVMRS